MICRRCGTQIEPQDNFCRNCGVRLAQSAGITAADKTSRTMTSSVRRLSSEAGRDARLAPAQERKGLDGATLFLGAVLLIAVAAGSVYFATHVLRQTGRWDPPSVGDTPVSLSRDESNRRDDTADNASASLAQRRPPQQSPSAPLESLDQSPSVISKPKPNTEPSEPAPRKPQAQTNERQSTGISSSGKTPASAPTSRRASAAGAYETRDSTPLFEQPSAASPVIANIPAGTRVDVVSSKGDWLEVHSRRGNPPGFIRRQDAKFLEKTD